MLEARVYPSDQWRLLSAQQNNNIQDMKVWGAWRGFNVPTAGLKLDNEGKLVIYQPFLPNLNLRISQVSASGT